MGKKIDKEDMINLIKVNFPNNKKAKSFVKSYLKLIIIIIISGVGLISLISYTMVLCLENKVLSLHKDTAKIQMENVDIKTQVEFAKSLYNVQNKAATLNFLHRPDKIIEVDYDSRKINVNNLIKPVSKPVEKVIGGY